MSEATKQAALQAALLTHGKGGDTSHVLAAAAEYHAFIVGDAAPAKTIKTSAAVKAAAPAKKKVVAPPLEDDEVEDETEDEAEDEDGVTKEQVGEAIAALIDNDQKDDAVAILKKYGAKSMSTLDAKHYEAVKAAAEKKLDIA